MFKWFLSRNLPFIALLQVWAVRELLPAVAWVPPPACLPTSIPTRGPHSSSTLHLVLPRPSTEAGREYVFQQQLSHVTEEETEPLPWVRVWARRGVPSLTQEPGDPLGALPAEAQAFTLWPPMTLSGPSVSFL